MEPWDDDDFDEAAEALEDEAADDLQLGPCCNCEATGPTVRNIMTLHRRAPRPGFGWGCLVCGLPLDGAVAVLCDACLESRAPIRRVCLGYPGEGERVLIESLADEPFDHDPAAHALDNATLARRN